MAALKIVLTDPSLRFTSVLLERQATNKQTMSDPGQADPDRVKVNVSRAGNPDSIPAFAVGIVPSGFIPMTYSRPARCQAVHGQ